jgi:hypothetical protein
LTPNGNNQRHKIDAKAKAINSCGTATAVAQQRPNLVSLLRVITITSEASVYFRDVRYRTDASTLNSSAITINQVMSLGFTLLKGNFAVKTKSIYFSDKIF